MVKNNKYDIVYEDEGKISVVQVEASNALEIMGNIVMGDIIYINDHFLLNAKSILRVEMSKESD